MNLQRQITDLVNEARNQEYATRRGAAGAEQRPSGGVGVDGNAGGEAGQEARVDKLQTEMLFLKKTLNELQTYQAVSGSVSMTAPQGKVASLDQEMAMPRVVRDMYRFWGITRSYFDEQARDFLKLLTSATESETFGYNQFELHSQKFTIPQASGAPATQRHLALEAEPDGAQEQAPAQLGSRISKTVALSAVKRSKTAEG